MNTRHLIGVLIVLVLVITGCHRDMVGVGPEEDTEVIEHSMNNEEVDTTQTVTNFGDSNIKEETNSIEEALNLDENEALESQEQPFRVSEIDDVTFTYMNGVSYKENPSITREDLRLVYLLYNNLDGEVKEGVLCVHKAIAEDMKDIFYELYLLKYPIDKIELVDNYEGNDNLSMAANNTSAFNYRVVAGSNKLSNHAYGLAIDINPLFNPYVTSSGIFPSEGAIYADRSLDVPGMIKKDDICYKVFISRGFNWGGDWVNSKDYQHFDKKIEGINK